MHTVVAIMCVLESIQCLIYVMSLMCTQLLLSTKRGEKGLLYFVCILIIIDTISNLNPKFAVDFFAAWSPRNQGWLFVKSFSLCLLSYACCLSCQLIFVIMWFVLIVESAIINPQLLYPPSFLLIKSVWFTIILWPFLGLNNFIRFSGYSG